MMASNQILVKVKTPSVPDFVRLAFSDGVIPIQDLSEDELRQIGEAWTQELVAKAIRKQLAARNEEPNDA